MGVRTGGNLVKSPGNEPYIVKGRLLGGSGVVSIKAGKGFAVSYTSAGRYKVTCDVNYPTFESAVATLYQSGGNYYAVKVISYAAGTGGAGYTIEFLVSNASTPTDLGSTEELNFVLHFARTVVP